jgi:hypothetical protein
MAIVTYKYRGFVTGTYTDPMQLRLLCALDIKVGGLQLRTISTYFLTGSLGEGSATFNQRIQRFLHTKSLSRDTKRADPTQFVKDSHRDVFRRSVARVGLFYSMGI